MSQKKGMQIAKVVKKANTEVSDMKKDYTSIAKEPKKLKKDIKKHKRAK